eukprot:TRINITY_DN11496_c0_g1_i4.p1 TRINITY_DN11496_c0_g1~~TRINITY_DN11496_c0_g1_i4.p1  ORF type:complete len:301 (-),score=50.62 TRINITY_DN11496_c0_g1_i4:1667-2515(-)
MSQQEGTIYQVKVVEFFERQVPIVLQNENGPCPLLSLVNVLSLRNKISSVYLSSKTDYIQQERLQQLVAEILLDSNQMHKNPVYQANQEQNISDAISSLPKLATGLDVNPRFTATNGFEFTNEITIFDLLDITLVHGWLVDPQDVTYASAIGEKTFNEISDFVVSNIGDAAAVQETVKQVLSPQASARLTISEQSSFSGHDPDLQQAIKMSLEGDLREYELIDKQQVQDDQKFVNTVHSIDSVEQISNINEDQVQVDFEVSDPESQLVTVHLRQSETGEAEE